MTLIEAIRARRSVRTFTGAPLTKEDNEELSGFISRLNPPFGSKARIALIRTEDDGKLIKLGTYGIIKGASDYMALIHCEGPMAEQGAGYMFEEAVLKCTQMGLGTCWLGGTVNRSDFIRQAGLKEGEQLLLVSPVGYPAEKRRLMERMMRSGAGSDSRKPFGELFFARDFSRPLNEEQAGIYLEPLEMVRLAPSASNSQPWRIITEGESIHFYEKKGGRFSGFDLGIAMCHFESACREQGIKGRFENIKRNPAEGHTYVISWIKE